MPVKRKKAKRRIDPKAECAAFACVFHCGNDWFDEASDFTGLPQPHRIWPPEAREEAQRAWDAAIEDAWHRVGHLFLATWEPDAARSTPWALETFGEPKCQ